MSGPYDYDDEEGPPICERCNEPCHFCESDFENGPEDPDPATLADPTAKDQ